MLFLFCIFQIVVLTKQTFATSCGQQTTSGLPSNNNNNNSNVSNTHLLHLRAVDDNFRQHLQAFHNIHTMMTSRTRRRSTSRNSTLVTRTELDHLTQCCDIYNTNNNNNNNNRLSISTNHNRCQYLPFEPTHLTTKNLYNNHSLHTSHLNHINTQPMK